MRGLRVFGDTVTVSPRFQRFQRFQKFQGFQGVQAAGASGKFLKPGYNLFYYPFRGGCPCGYTEALYPFKPRGVYFAGFLYMIRLWLDGMADLKKSPGIAAVFPPDDNHALNLL